MSPSMDILISSNLERLLYLIAGSEETASYMKQLNEKGVYNDFKISWKTQGKSTFDVKAFKAEYPHINLNKYYKTSTSRPFKLTKNN